MQTAQPQIDTNKLNPTFSDCGKHRLGAVSNHNPVMSKPLGPPARTNGEVVGRSVLESVPTPSMKTPSVGIIATGAPGMNPQDLKQTPNVRTNNEMGLTSVGDFATPKNLLPPDFKKPVLRDIPNPLSTSTLGGLPGSGMPDASPVTNVADSVKGGLNSIHGTSADAVGNIKSGVFSYR